jgi:hypothetical protein
MKSSASRALLARNRQRPQTDSGHHYPPTVFRNGEGWRQLLAPMRRDFGRGGHERAEPRRALEPRLVA